MQIRTGEEIGVVLCLVSCLHFRCLDRQILFEKELRPLARCFGKSEIKVLLGSMQNLIFLNRIKIRVHVLGTSSELDVL